MKVRIRDEHGVIRTYYVKHYNRLKGRGYAYNRKNRVWYKLKRKVREPKPEKKKVVKGVIVTIAYDYRSRRGDQHDVDIDAVAQDSVVGYQDEIERKISSKIRELVDYIMTRVESSFSRSLAERLRRRPYHYEILDRRLLFDVDIKYRHRGQRWRRL